MNTLEKVNVKPPAVQEHPSTQVTGNMILLKQAMDSGATGDDLKNMMDLYERMEDRAARKAFDEALALAQAEMPTIVKNKHVYFEGRNGGRPTDYWHEDHAGVVEAIKPILHKHGLGQRHSIKQAVVNGSMLITVTCIITGHGWREEVELSSGPDDNPSGMNAIQRIKSATTYLKRTTLETALGLASAKDDDGKSAISEPKAEEYTPPEGSVSQDQIDQLRELMESLNVKPRAFLGWAKQKRIEDIPADQFDACIAGIKHAGGAQK